jgi:hypothetical protein
MQPTNIAAGVNWQLRLPPGGRVPSGLFHTSSWLRLKLLLLLLLLLLLRLLCVYLPLLLH